ncbi:S8 family peptidase [Cytophaga aurantiaca]|uniref:S8 family peptidase n=1 Tax=Cytophaga aurantiaca TaxID=29530 RepID=UPI00035FFB66|nr:S8 family serine peptidase [Cytophaga aurantiaca]
MQTIQRAIIVSSLLIAFFFQGNAQIQKYWISFKDKDLSGYNYENNLSAQTISNRTIQHIPLFQYTDVPVTTSNISTLNSLDVTVVATSKWLNAVTAYLAPEQVNQVRQLTFVSSVEPVGVYLVASSTDINVAPDLMHPAMKQMKAKTFTSNGIDGTNITIGVIDAGFHKLHEDPATSYLVRDKKILGQRDFIDRSRTDLISKAATSSDDHGRQVVRMIAGYDTTLKAQYGMAVNASFYLARTENGDREYRGEEDMWIMAMEWMDSVGVRLISTSLGYAIKMDDPNDNYTEEQMDGKTARITKAAQIAFSQKGILLAVSAGNEGDTNWRIISAPADAEGALSVGATNSLNWDRISYSSIGPENLPYLKPNVSCYSPNGTSFSCPAIAGFVACLMKNDSTLSNVQLKNIIQKSAHLYPYGNNYIGYGIPQADRALELSKDTLKKFDNVVSITVSKDLYKYTFDETISVDLVVFNKKNETIVMNQQVVSIEKGDRKNPIIKIERWIPKIHLINRPGISVKNGKLKIKRGKGVARTTVVADEFLTLEIIWE